MLLCPTWQRCSTNDRLSEKSLYSNLYQFWKRNAGALPTFTSTRALSLFFSGGKVPGSWLQSPEILRLGLNIVWLLKRGPTCFIEIEIGKAIVNSPIGEEGSLQFGYRQDDPGRTRRLRYFV